MSQNKHTKKAIPKGTATKSAAKPSPLTKKNLLIGGIAALLLIAVLFTVLFLTVLRPFRETDEVTRFVAIEVEDYGTIIVKLKPGTAPITVENFQNLVADGIYDGSCFHRIIEGFMIQGGEPTADKPIPEEIKGEFAANGIENNLRHKRGVISMARTQVYDSATSQFFIVHDSEGAAHLDGSYAAFGKVVRGMDVVDKIAAARTDYTDAPLRTIEITRAYFVK